MSPGPARIPVPRAFAAVVIALCAVLLLKWLAVVALIAWGVTVLARWLWRRRARTPAGPRLALPAPRPAPTVAAAEPPGEDCSWCGLAGGHRDLRGRPVRPRHAHEVRCAPVSTNPCHRAD